MLKHLKAECVIPKHRINQMPVRCWCSKTNVKKRIDEKGNLDFLYFLTRLNNSSSRSSLLCLKLFAKRLKWMIELRHVAWKVAFSMLTEFFSRFHYYVDKEKKSWSRMRRQGELGMRLTWKKIARLHYLFVRGWEEIRTRPKENFNSL